MNVQLMILMFWEFMKIGLFAVGGCYIGIV